jgi:hypothetical protein
MENKKEIGEIFRTKLSNLDKMPNDNLWSSIEKDLDKRKKRRILFWFIPSIVMIGILSSVMVLNQNRQDTNCDTSSKKETVLAKEKKQKILIQAKKVDKTSKSTNSNPVLITKNKSSETSETTTIKKSRTEKLIKQSTKLIVSTDEIEEYEVIKKYKVVIKKTKIVTKINKKSNSKTPIKPNRVVQKNSKKGNYTKKGNRLTDTKKTSIATNKKTLDTINNNENIKKATENESSLLNKKADTIKEPLIDGNSKKKTTLKREYKEGSSNYEEELNPDFYLTIFYGPTIFGSLSGDSMINPSFTNLSKSHPITSFYGFYLKTMYNKIGFRAGISKINLEMSTRLNKNQMIQNYTNIELNSNTTVVTINNAFNGSEKVDLVQKFSYYELPLEFNYSIQKDESKIGLDVFSGFSVMIRDKNSIYLSSKEIKNLNIGFEKNVASLNISYNIGLNLNYKLNEKFQIDFNPIFKYYLSSFKEKDNTSKPYSFSIQPGLTYKF